MIQEHIENIESKLRAAKNVPAETRTEILSLLAALKADVSTLGVKPAAGGAEPGEGAAEGVVHDLTRSVEGFEASHPDLVANVNRLAVILSNMGI